MIAADQPRCFDDMSLSVGVSSRADGTMLDRTLGDRHAESIVANRRHFTAQVGVDYESCVYQIINYADGRTYDNIVEVSTPDNSGVAADMLYTEAAGVGLFLPVADCVATVIYDPSRQALALAHIGRHASIAKLMVGAIRFFASKGSRPEDLIIWMAPSVAASDYKMQYFDYLDDPDWQGFAHVMSNGIYLDLAGFNSNLAQNFGVLKYNIHISPVNTTRDGNYFSHSQGDITGRFAVVAEMKR